MTCSHAWAGRPMIVNEVLADIGRERANTSAMTTLAGLHVKHAMSTWPAGRACAYSVLAGRCAGIGHHSSDATPPRWRHGSGRRAGRSVADLSHDGERVLIELLARDAVNATCIQRM